MPEIKREVTLTVDDGEVTFRRPTNAEISEFHRRAFPMGKKGKVRNNLLEAQVWYFDLLVTGLANFRDDGKPIAIDDTSAIPNDWKQSMIVEAFGDPVDIEVKNSPRTSGSG